MQYPISALHIYFNLLQQSTAIQLFNHNKLSNSVGIMVKNPFVKGLLTSKNSMGIRKSPLLNEKYLNSKIKQLESLNVRRKRNHSALKFILQYPQVSVALNGTTSIKHLEDNLEYIDAKVISSQELKQIQKIQELFPM